MIQGLNLLNFQKPSSPAHRQICEQAIAQWLAQTSCDLQLAAKLNQTVEWAAVELGTVILEGQTQPQFASPEEAAVYWVVQGRVRILCPSGSRREVSAQVLETGATLSQAALWMESPLAYRAVAAGSGWVARIAAKELKPWLEQWPELATLLRQEAQTRDNLIFFKSQVFTEGRSPTSYQLQKLLENLETQGIGPGQSLQALEATDYYWLRRGSIGLRNPDAPDHPTPPQPGQGWGYPASGAAHWVAQEPLVIYRLPRDRWADIHSVAPDILPFWQPVEGAEGTTSTSEDDYPSEQTLHRRLTRRRNQRPHQTPPAIASLAGIRASKAGAASTPNPTPAGSDRRRSEPNVEFPTPRHRPLGHRLWRRYPFIAQQSAADCGPTCLAMIAQYWGHRLNLNVLREMAYVGRSGATIKNLAGAAEKAGFAARPVRASLSVLAEQRLPWVAHWQGDHYVVVYRVQGDRLWLADPARGKRQISRQLFQRNWSGYALLLEPTDRLKQSEAAQKASLGRFWKVLWPYRSILGQIILISLLMQVFGLVSPIFTQVILDQVVVQKSIDTLNIFALGALLFGVWRIGLGSVRQYLLDYFSNRLNLTLVSAFVNHALRLPMSFFENRQVGDIITRIQENRKIQAFLVRQAVSTWLDATMALVYMGLMFYYNAQLAWLVLALLPPIILLTLAATPFLKQLSREVFNKAAEQNSLLVEMLSGIATVKAAAAEQEVRWRWEDRLTQLLNIQFQAQKLTNSLQVVGGIINAVGGLALLWYGAKLVIQDELTIGQLMAFNMLIGNVIGPVLALVGLWDEFQEVLIAVERLNDVLETSPEDFSGQPMLILPQIKGEVRFEDVTFRYDAAADRNILQNVSFTIQSGETVALVGRSGSGKTTLIKLLQGMYHPTNGRILIDGHDIARVSPNSLRSQMGVVPQESFLFSGTILENIQLYRDDYSLAEAVEVAKLAEAHSFIQELPMGYSTKVGERGANLSGGQRQRVAIARALLGDPAILLLDEATSALDTESERRFQQNLAHISQGRTTFIIAHRLSTVRNADRILVLDKGIVVEQGNHESLVAQRGLYYHLAQQQLEL